MGGKVFSITSWWVSFQSLKNLVIIFTLSWIIKYFPTLLAFLLWFFGTGIKPTIESHFRNLDSQVNTKIVDVQYFLNFKPFIDPNK